MQTAIRFKAINRYRRAIGSIDTEMGYGVHHALVQRGIAEFVPLSESLPSDPEQESDIPDNTTQRERKPRRSPKE